MHLPLSMQYWTPGEHMVWLPPPPRSTGTQQSVTHSEWLTQGRAHPHILSGEYPMHVEPGQQVPKLPRSLSLHDSYGSRHVGSERSRHISFTQESGASHHAPNPQVLSGHSQPRVPGVQDSSMQMPLGWQVRPAPQHPASHSHARVPSVQSGPSSPEVVAVAVVAVAVVAVVSGEVVPTSPLDSSLAVKAVSTGPVVTGTEPSESVSSPHPAAAVRVKRIVRERRVVFIRRGA